MLAMCYYLQDCMQKAGLTTSILIDMVGEGCKPNETTYPTLIQCTGIKCMTNEAMKLYNELTARGTINESFFISINNKCICKTKDYGSDWAH